MSEETPLEDVERALSTVEDAVEALRETLSNNEAIDTLQETVDELETKVDRLEDELAAKVDEIAKFAAVVECLQQRIYRREHLARMHAHEPEYAAVSLLVAKELEDVLREAGLVL